MSVWATKEIIPDEEIMSIDESLSLLLVTSSCAAMTVCATSCPMRRQLTTLNMSEVCMQFRRYVL